MSEDYEVRAKIELDRARRAQSTLNSLSTRLQGMHATLGRVNSGASSLTRNLVAVGATYLGIRALSNAFNGMSSQTIRVNSEVEDMQVALSTLMATAEQISFQRATDSAGALFRRLNDIAVQSPATATQLMDVFRGVYGPLRSAGTGMEDLLGFTRNAAAVGAALQVDYAQLSRDVGMMATGVAGTDVKTFRLLRSMNLITESTEEWNRMAQQDSSAAARKLLEVFEQLGGPAADAFGRTWTGVSSTFRGLVEQFMRVFSGPTFAVVRDTLRSVNTFLLRYRANLERVLSAMGSRVGRYLQGVVDRARGGFNSLVANFDAVAMTLDRALDRFNELRPILTQIGKVLLIARVVTLALGPLFALLAGAGTLFSGISSIAGALGIGGAAGGGAAAAGGAAAGGGAAAAGGGVSAALSALGAALWPVVVVVGVVVGVITSLWAAFNRFGDIIRAMWTDTNNLSEVFAEVGANLMSFFADTWVFLEPIFAMLGAVIITAVITVLRVLGGLLIVVTGALRLLGIGLRWLGENIIAPLAEATVMFFAVLFRIIGLLGDAFIGLYNWIRGFIGAEDSEETAQTNEEAVQSSTFQGLLDTMRRIWSAEGAPTAGVTPGGDITAGAAPGGRSRTNIDMRGSRINVRQDFREADPDRIFVQMRDALESEVTSRTQSGFVPALAR